MTVTSGNGSNVLALDYPQSQENVISNRSQQTDEDMGICALYGV
jgi:hypothetical protein